MDDSGRSETNTVAETAVESGTTGHRSRPNTVRAVVWAVVSLAFVGYIAFGSAPARIWRFGELEIESKSILGVWRVQAGSLPDVSNGWLLEWLFNGSAVVVVICVVLLMRYLLMEANDDSVAIESDSS